MRFLAIVFVVFALACNSSTSSPTEPNGPIEPQLDSYVIPFGSSVQVNSDLRVSFTEVLEESRCPANVVCVWMGNGKIKLDLQTGRGAGSVILNTAGSNGMPREASALGYTFTLVDLQPYPQTDGQIPHNQYSAGIRITRTR